MQHAPTPLGSGQPLARYFGKYFGKYFVLSYKKYFVLRTVSCIRQFRPVSCVRALRSCHSPCLMFSSSPRTVASGKRGGHPSNRAPPTNPLARLFLTWTADSSLDENGISNRKIMKEATLFGLKLCLFWGKGDFCGGLWSFDAHCGTFATAVVSEA